MAKYSDPARATDRDLFLTRSTTDVQKQVWDDYERRIREEAFKDAIVLRPYPNEHACRVKEPGLFEANSFRSIDQAVNGKPIRLIIGRLKGETATTLQAIRYPKDKWEAAAAKTH